jgi:hypothetical protein
MTLNFKEKVKLLEKFSNKNNYEEIKNDNEIKKNIIVPKENLKHKIEIFDQNNDKKIKLNKNKIIKNEEIIEFFTYKLKLLNNNIIDLACKNYFFIFNYSNL